MPPVIERQPDGTQLLDFKDWTPEMMALASCMFELPRRPRDTGPSTHEFGIDRLAKLPRGGEAVGMLYDHVSSIEWRPEEDEVVGIGRTLLALQGELDQLYRDRRRNRRASQDRRRATKRPRDAIESDHRRNGQTPIRFRRGPKAR
jgi:hypothetical protein